MLGDQMKFHFVKKNRGRLSTKSYSERKCEMKENGNLNLRVNTRRNGLLFLVIGNDCVDNFRQRKESCSSCYSNCYISINT